MDPICKHCILQIGSIFLKHPVNPTLKIVIWLDLSWTLNTASAQGISSLLQIKPNSNLRKTRKKEKQNDCLLVMLLNTSALYTYAKQGNKA